MSDARTLKALEQLQPAIEDMKASIVREVNRLITDNELTPELALQKWYELHALETLPKKVIREVHRARGGK